MVRSTRGPVRAAPVGRAGCVPVSETPPGTTDLLAELERLRTVTSLMTAADPDVVPTAVALGAVASMRKPLGVGLLLETVARHC